MILRKEADKLGVSIDTKAVNDYIQAATLNKLTKETFQEILSGLKISEHKLYEIIADELRVKTTFELLAPFRASTNTPATALGKLQ